MNSTENYRDSLRSMLRSKGVSDVLLTDFKDFDSETDKTKFNFRLVLGNLALIIGNFLTPKEEEKRVTDFLNKSIS